MIAFGAAVSVLHRTDANRAAALVLANEIRFARARMKEALRTGRRPMAAEIVKTPPRYVTSMKLFKLLVSIPGFGPVRAHKLMLYARIADGKTVGGLSPRQRDEVVAALLADIDG